ncbi:hypothetical protein L596_028599 [Steinernema carpocapsae]|uniref:Uncharacterized protein n=1 Tax=Steinernema carpocapsae TaxID=34508 RepID=A0A4U5LYW2_STECR|nr:hypothetical protein L596_028599 [Steinernema carpocapsae]
MQIRNQKDAMKRTRFFQENNSTWTSKNDVRNSVGFSDTPARLRFLNKKPLCLQYNMSQSPRKGGPGGYQPKHKRYNSREF